VGPSEAAPRVLVSFSLVGAILFGSLAIWIMSAQSLPHPPNRLEQTQSDFHLFLNALKHGSGKHAEWRVFKSVLFQGRYLIAFRPRVFIRPVYFILRMPSVEQWKF
jgi:hypothetical protein